MTIHGSRCGLLAVLGLALGLALAACASSSSADSPPPACDQLCLDQTALRALRESLKLVFNLTLQGKPVGAQDATVACPLGGQARVFGVATSNATQGSTEVRLAYHLEGCTVLQRDNDPKESYRLVLSGDFQQEGILAVQPTATTALAIQGSDVSMLGTVSDPPVPYEERSCSVRLSQDGNRLSGTLCGRDTTTDL